MTPTDLCTNQDIDKAGDAANACALAGKYEEAAAVRRVVAALRAALASPEAGCLCCSDGCQDGCGCKDTSRSDDLPPMGRRRKSLASPAAPPAPADLVALGQILDLYANRMAGERTAIALWQAVCDWKDDAAKAAAAPRVPERDTPGGLVRHAWEAGFRLAVAYGDNRHHWEGQQREDRWLQYLASLPAPPTPPQEPIR